MGQSDGAGIGKLVLLLPDFITAQVGFSYPPEIFITAAAPEQMVNRFDHIQVRQLPSHQGMQFQ